MTPGPGPPGPPAPPGPPPPFVILAVVEKYEFDSSLGSFWLSDKPKFEFDGDGDRMNGGGGLNGPPVPPEVTEEGPALVVKIGLFVFCLMIPPSPPLEGGGRGGRMVRFEEVDEVEASLHARIAASDVEGEMSSVSLLLALLMLMLVVSSLFGLMVVFMTIVYRREAREGKGREGRL